jgi:hypothetical protein
MIQFQHRIEIDRSPAEVFALLSDVERLPAWQKSVVAVKPVTAGPVRAGSEFDQTWKLMGRRRRVPTRVAAHKPVELVAFAGDAGFADFYCAFELTPAASGGAILISRNEFRLHGLWKLVQPLLAGETRREFAAEIEAFKRLAEGGSSAQPATAS